MTEPPSTPIRAATEADSAAIGRLHVAAWDQTYRGLMPDSVIDAISAADRAAQWRSGLTRGEKGPLVHVATDADGGLMGFGAAGPSRDATHPWEAEIYALYVLRPYQRRGIGHALLRSLAGELASRGRRSVGLWVLTANVSARAFYETIGGRVVQQRIDRSEDWSCDETAYLWDDIGAALPR